MIEWKITSANPNYSVSNTGLVRNDRTGKVLKNQLNSHGYHVVSLGKGNTKSVHSLVALAFLNAPTEQQTEVAHNDGTRTNNCVDNLRWATKTENQQDRIIHNTTNRGEKGGLAKLTNSQVVDIRKLMQSTKINNCELGRMYDMSYESIRAIRHNQSYKEAA